MGRILNGLFFFGIIRERYRSLRKYNSRGAIKQMANELGTDSINRGYQVAVYHTPKDTPEVYRGKHMVVENAKYVSGIFGVDFISSSGLWDDFAGCRRAEEDGIRLINDMPGLEKGRYVDTPENREICRECLERKPVYRVENWMRTYSGYGRKYSETYGDPACGHGNGVIYALLIFINRSFCLVFIQKNNKQSP